VSYTKIYNTRKFAGISNILVALMELPPGDSYDIEGGEGSLKKIRWLLYDWLAHTEMKEEFKVKRLIGRLVVQRLPILEVRGRRVGEDEEEIQRAVEIALKEKEPGKALKKLLSGDKLGRALQKLGRLVDGKDKSQGKGVEEDSERK